MDRAFHEPLRHITDKDGSRFSKLLQACRQVGRVANSRVVHPEVVANATDHHEPCIQPHTERTGHAVRFSQFGLMVLEKALQC
jgi:hypothetical protein